MSSIKWRTRNEYYSTVNGAQLEEGHAKGGSFINRIVNEKKEITNGYGTITRQWECRPVYKTDLFGKQNAEE